MTHHAAQTPPRRSLFVSLLRLAFGSALVATLAAGAFCAMDASARLGRAPWEWSEGDWRQAAEKIQQDVRKVARRIEGPDHRCDAPGPVAYDVPEPVPPSLPGYEPRHTDASASSEPRRPHLGRDARDFAIDTADATREGWRIAHGDPAETANRLMTDPEYAAELEAKVNRLTESSERIQSHVDRHSATVERIGGAASRALDGLIKKRSR
jgi:hypothetical protein